MATLKKYNLVGKEIGTIEVSDELANAEANGQMIKDYIIALRANARQWSANTKTRAEVSHSTKKPHPQKGGGRARQGSLAAPQYKGGGRVHAPRPKFDQHVRINKKERLAAIRSLLGEKIRDSRLIVIDDLAMDAPKTKTVVGFLKALSISGRVLFLGEKHSINVGTDEFPHHVSVQSDKFHNFVKSLRNIQKVTFSTASNINGYDLAMPCNLVVTESALKELNDWLT